MSISPGLKRVVVNLLSHISTYMTALLEVLTGAGSRLIMIPDVRRFLVKVKILTGLYVLQYNRAKFNQHAGSPTCCL